MTQRAVSPVVGIVLLVGITAVASIGLLVASASLTDTTQSTVEYEQAEQSMSQLAETADQVAHGEVTQGEFAIDGARSGQVRAFSDTGTINVTVTNRSNDTVLLTLERDLGSVVYEGEDGTEIAYQGGGVWRQDPQGNSRVVHPPEFHYRSDPDPTITFPIVLVRDDFTTEGSTAGRISAAAAERHYPDRPSHYNPLVQGSVEITIESEYCEGWEQYFRERTDGSAAEGCEAGTEGQLVIQFSVPFQVDGLGNGVAIGDGNGDPDDFDGIDDSSEFNDSEDMPSATPIVEAQMEDAQESGEVVPDSDTIDESGLYYDDGNLSAQGSTLTFNTTGGDIEIATSQDPVFDSQVDLDVVGENNVTIYTDSEHVVDSGGGSGELGTPGNASQFRIFVHSDVDTFGENGQNTDFHGLIYAPNTEVLLFQGNNNASGALVAEDYDFGNTEMEIDSDLTGITFYEQIGDAPFYYLHISETEVNVDPE